MYISQDLRMNTVFSQLLCLDEGVLNVVNLLKSPSGAVQRNAAWVLAMLAVDSKMADEITKYGLEKLILV